MDEQELFNDSEMTEFNSQPKIQEVSGVSTIDPISTVSSNTAVRLGQPKSAAIGSNTTNSPKSTAIGAKSTAINSARNKAGLDLASGIEHVLDDREKEDYVSTKALYQKSLGVTEYSELRSKLNLRDDESFTDYYNRTHYVPEGFELQAKLLLAEEKRKKLYAEVQSGNMSEEDFLYEAYGKDLLKSDGIDFESPLYWYQEFKKGNYDDPRDNSTYMLQLIESARTLFQAEKWYEESQTADMASILEGLVTGEELPATTIQEIFAEQFDELTKYYDNAEQIVKYYRAGMLQGFNPTIDINSDGKIDYYLATDGKLYNVNETGEGANTYRAYYNSDGSLNRIVASDSYVGEIAGEFFKSIGRFFTGVVDLGALAIGAVVDIADGGKFGDTIANYQASMSQFWNTTIVKDSDYIVDNSWTKQDGSFNWEGVGRQISSLAGTVASFIITTGMSTAISASSKLTTVGGKIVGEIPKGLAGSTAKVLHKLGSTKMLSQGLGKGIKFAAKHGVSTALQLTSWSNGAFGSGIGARVATSSILAVRDGLQSVATLAANQKQLGLSDSEVVTHAIGGAAINFGATLALRQVADQGAMKAWAQFGKSMGKVTAATAKGAIANKTAPTLFSRILTGTMTAKEKIGVGVANTAMDAVENIITAWTQSSLSRTGKVLDINSLKDLFMSPQFVANAVYQTHMSFNDELRVNKNGIIGVTTDTVVMDQEYRAWVSTLKQNAKTPDAAAKFDALLVNYDKEIQTNMGKVNPVTGQNYTRAEATLAALDKQVKKLDLQPKNEFISKQRDRVKKYINETKIMYAQAVFNNANNNYKAYTDISKQAWGLKANFLYGKETDKLYDAYAEVMQKYFAVPIDTQLYYDTYHSDYTRYITNKVRKYKEDANLTDDSFKIVTGVEKIETDENGIHNTKYAIKDVPETAVNNYNNEVVAKFGMNGRAEDIFIIGNNKGDSAGQKELLRDNEILKVTANVEKEIAELSDVAPFIVDLGDGVYCIPNIAGLGMNVNTLTNVSTVFNTLRLIRYKYENSKELKEHFFDIVGIIYQKDIATMELEEQKKYLTEFRVVLNNLCGEAKPLNNADAVRIINALKLEGIDILDSIKENESGYSHLIHLQSMTKMYDSYESMKTSYKALLDSTKDNKELSASQYEEHGNNIANFKRDYPFGNKLRNEGEKLGLLNGVLLKNIDQELPFEKDLQDGLPTRNLLKQIRELTTSGSSNLSEEEKKAIFKAFLDRFGYNSQPISNSEVVTEIINAIERSLADLSLIRDEEGNYKVPGKIKKDEGDNLRELLTDTIGRIQILEKAINNTPEEKAEAITREITDMLTKIQDPKGIFKKLHAEDVKAINTDQKAEGHFHTAINNAKQILILKVLNKFGLTPNLDKYNDYKTRVEQAISEGKKTPRNTLDEATKLYYLLSKEFGEIKETTDLIKIIPQTEEHLRKNGYYTVNEIKNLETMFNEDLKLAEKIHKHTKQIEARKVLVIDLNRVVGDTGFVILNKFKNDKLLDDFINGDEQSKYNQLFSNKSNMIAFQKEMSKLRTLKRTYNEDVLYFDITNPQEERLAKGVLENLYNYQYTVRNADDIEMPGIYLVSKDTSGLELNTNISALKLAADNYNNSRITDQTIDLTEDFFSVFESLSSGFDFITEDSTIDPRSIIINNMKYTDENGTRTFKDVINYINHAIDVKLGKLAGNKVKVLRTGFTAFGLADNDIDLDITKKYLISRAIDIAEECFKTPSAAALISKPDKDKLAKYAQFYDIHNYPGESGKVYLIPKKNIEFKKEAYAALEKDTSNIKYILALNSVPVDPNNKLIGVNQEGKVLTGQLTTGNTPYSLVFEKLLSEFTSTDIKTLFASMVDSKKKDISIKEEDIKYSDDILKHFQNKTVKQILDEDKTDLTFKNNIYYQMQLRAIEASLEVTAAYKSRLTQNNINDNVISMLGDRNFRANLATVMNDSTVRSKMTFTDGKLDITDNLIKSIIQKFNNIQISAHPDDSKNVLDINSKGTKTILTGSQTASLNSKHTIDFTNVEDLKTFLKLSDIKNVSLTNINQTFNPLQTFYAMVLAATGESNKNSYVALKDLHHLSDTDCYIILKELENVLDNKSFKELKDTIYLLKTGKEFSKNSKDLSEDEYVDTIIRQGIGSKKSVSINSADGKIINITDQPVIKELELFERALTNAIKNNYGKEKLKISSIVDSSTNNFAHKFYNAFTKLKAPNSTNKGSLLIANMDISSNRAALFTSIASLAKTFTSDNIKEEFKLSSNLSLEEAAQLALDLYMYTTGDDYQPHYPQYIIYNKKKRKIISTANSSKSYNKEYDDLITELFLHTNVEIGEEKTGEFVNKTSGNKPSSKDMMIISLPRNSLASIFTPDISPDISIMHLDEKDSVGKARVKSLIDYSYTNFVNHYKARHKKELTSEAKLQEEWVKSLFNKRVRTAKYEDAKNKELANEFLLDEEVADDIFNTISSYSFTTDSESLGETRVKAALKDDNFRNILKLKEDDAIKFGITDDQFNKRSGFVNIIKEQRNTLNKDLKKKFKLKDFTPLDDLVDAIVSKDDLTIKLAVNNLPEDLKKNPNDVIKYVIANLDTLESKMFMLTGKEHSNEYYNNKKIEDNYTIKVDGKYTKISKIKKAARVVGDTESIYTADETIMYQAAFIADNNTNEKTSKELYLPLGRLHNDVQTKVDLEEIKSGEDLANFLLQSGFTDWYYTYYKKNPGTQQSIQALYNAYKNKNIYKGDPIDLKKELNIVTDEKPYFVGFNNGVYDNTLILDNINDAGLNELIRTRSLDLRVIKDEVPTIFQFRNQRKEGALPGTLDTAGIKAGDSHSGIADATDTDKLFDTIFSNIIQENKYQHTILNTIESISKHLGLEEIPKDLIFNWSVNKEFLNKQENRDYNKLLKINSPENAMRKLRSIVDYYNFRNTMSAVHTSDILEKDVREQIFSGLNSGQIRFANTFKNKALKAEAKELISIAINKESKQSAANVDLAKIKVMNALTQDKEYYPENDMAYNMSDVKGLKSLLGLTDEDINNYRELPLENKYSIDTDISISSKPSDILLKRLDTEKQSLINGIRFATKDIEKEVNDILTKTIPNEDARNYILESLNTYFDIDKEALDANGGIPPKANFRALIDAISKIDKDTWDIILDDPFLSKGYTEIYRMVTATPLNKKLKVVGGTESILKNDTLAITQKQLSKLMKVNNLTEETLRQSLGLGNNDTLYIPVVRHPLDKTDSVHFLKVMIIEEGQGVDIAVNADTMKTRFNGDLDGDHIMILKPSAALEKFANKTNKNGESLAGLQHEPLNILYNLLEKNNDGNFFINKADRDVTHLHQTIAMDNRTGKKNLDFFIKDQLRTLQPQALSNYDSAKATFTENLKEKIKEFPYILKDYPNDDKFLEDFVDEVFWVRPIDMTAFNNVENNTRLVTFSDYLGLQNDSDNLEARRRYRYGEISTYGTLRLGDSESGTLQKLVYNKEHVSYEDLKFVENLIRLSNTTKSALNNIDEAKQNKILSELLTSSKIFKRGETHKRFLDGIKNINFADKVEQILIVTQLHNMAKRQELAGEAIKELQKDASQDSDARFINYYLGLDSNIKDFAGSIDFVLNLKQELKNSFSSSTSDINESIDTMFNLFSGRQPKKKELTDKSRESLYTKMPVVYVVNPKAIGFTDIVTEDTILPLRGLDNYIDIKPKIFNLNIDSIKDFISYKNNNKTLPKQLLKKLNLSEDLEGMVRVIDINKDTNTLLVSIATTLNGQKIVFASTNASKSTVSSYASLNNKKVETFLNTQGAAFIKLYGQDAAKKAIEAPNKNVTYYTVDTTGEAQNIKAKRPTKESIAFFIVDEEVNMAEAPRLYNQEAKESQFEELAHANNIDSINGAFMWNGYLYKVDEKVNTVSFDNDPLFKIKQKIDRANMPDRIDSNGYNLYLLLKAIVVAKQEGLSKEKFAELYSLGPSGWKHYTDNVISSTTDKSFESVILSKELEDYIMEDTLTRVNANMEQAVKETRSENSAQHDQERASLNAAHEFATGNLTDLNNGKHNFQASHYIPKHLLINKINELMGNTYTLYRSKLQRGEELELFSNGVYQRRTQTSNGPREEYTKELSALSNNTTNLKTGAVYTAENTVRENPSLFPGDLLSEDYSPEDRFTGFKRIYHKDRQDYKSNKINKFNGLLSLLKTEEFNSDIELAQVFKGTQEAIASIKTDYRGFTKEGDLDFSIKPTKIRESTQPKKLTIRELLKIIEDLGVSSTYYTQLDQFKKEVQLSDNNINTQPSMYSNIQNMPDIVEGIANAEPLNKDITSQVSQIKEKYNRHLSIENVVNDADRRFYSGETKLFTAEKIKMNKGIKLDSTEAIEADRVIKEMSTEANSISMTYEKQLVLLNTITERNQSTDITNKFAYVLGAANKIQVIDKELKETKDTSKRDRLLKTRELTLKSLKELKVENPNKFIEDFTKRYTEEANIVYTLLQQLNSEASKYSKLCGEPGDNIFFLLTPSIPKNKRDAKIKFEYIVSMIAKGNNPIQYDKEKLSWVSTSMPVYDGYNFISSLATSITAISKQAAIYNNSLRLKDLGMMTNASLSSIVMDTLSSEEALDKFKTFNITKDHEIAFELYLSGLQDIFKTDNEVLALISKLRNASHLTIPEKYKEALILLDGYINKMGLTLEQASSAETLNNMPEFDRDTYYTIIAAYNVYADTFAELSSFYNDDLIDMAYTKVVDSLSENQVLVDKFGRKLEDLENAYALSEQSLEVWIDVLDATLADGKNNKRNHRRNIINQLLKGELFIMDKVLADALSENVFVKKPLKGMKERAKKAASICVTALMSNPLKIIDRFIKFSMFDTAALSTANTATLTKTPKAFKDLRAYFASKGLVSTSDLDEFMYSQGVNINSANFDTIYNGNNSALGFNPLKTYTDAVGNVFTYQTLATRYAYWLATKESIEKGDYSVLGSAYYLKDELKNIQGTNKVSKAGQQASFAMAQNIGAPGDFPGLSKTLGDHGMVFTTFPLAAARWGIGETRSLATIVSEIMKGQFNSESAKWLFRNGGGIIGTFAAEALIISVIADMFGIQSIFDDDEDEEQEDDRRKEWKDTGAMLNLTQTILTGEPIMDTYSSMNITRELKGLTIDPFLKNEDNSSGGISRFFYKNIMSHINPVAKNAIEVVSGKDIIDDKVIDTKGKYTMFENIARKFSSYFIGAAGANALINNRTNYDSIGENFANGLTAAISAECGNTKVYKSNLKNYYKALNKINAYLYSDTTSQYLQDTDIKNVKTELQTLIAKQPQITDVYALIQSLSNKGYDPSEIRSAFRGCSLQYKLEQVQDIEDLRDSLTDASFNNIKTAIAFENYMYPWLNEGINYLDRYIQANYNNSNKYIPSFNYGGYNYSNYYNTREPNYTKPYTNNYNKSNTTKPFEAYSQSQQDIKYQQQQAEYARQRKQWEDN